ncbi:MAG: hypothetical protein [Bacteriophage sp.]|nr:MAG: hypothetical protein [Bacteriophage sp.]
MKKAILVNDYQGVTALNELFDKGFTVESVDNNGVYILNCDEVETDKIKKKTIDNELSTNISLDTTKAKQSFDLLVETVSLIKAVEQSKKIHICTDCDEMCGVLKRSINLYGSTEK